MLPSLFIAHGAPLLAVEANEYTQFLRELGENLPRPRAVVLFSAHWLAGVQRVSAVDTYETIHDFGGFPEELYQIQYPAKGDAEMARAVEARLAEHGIPSAVDTGRGLDHGAWVVLRLLYPEADVPVVAMSVNPRLTPAEQYDIGKALAALRQEDVLLIGSGGTVHNLGALAWNASQPNDWALAFDQWLERHVKAWDLGSLFQYEALAPHARLAVPPHGNEHFAPLLYAMGAADDVRTAALLHRSYRYGSLSQSVWQFG
ncbi:dioxygenase [Alicyclobacillus contaminans]|uniref:dioxygenase family protein n=1 Tax=Alicyclobacillus contaminans TaxID=392016 RepID=UPI00047D506F|nr:class III extradiol ring-cleavage dioxygenase [Alicyclobacillus contaminans]GMA51040.1 dioxygenase [Alicyclobacillus contaminans]